MANRQQLSLASLEEKVIKPAEEKARELERLQK